MISDGFPFEEIEALTFNPKPQPLPANLRPIYRIVQIALVLKINCLGNSASLLKLQFFNWLLKSPEVRTIVQERLTQQSIFTLELIHLDPMVNLALSYAFADNLITVTNTSKYKLTEKGHKFADQILQDEEMVLSEEREILIGIGKKVSEVKLRDTLL